MRLLYSKEKWFGHGDYLILRSAKLGKYLSIIISVDNKTIKYIEKNKYKCLKDFDLSIIFDVLQTNEIKVKDEKLITYDGIVGEFRDDEGVFVINTAYKGTVNYIDVINFIKKKYEENNMCSSNNK